MNKTLNFWEIGDFSFKEVAEGEKSLFGVEYRGKELSCYFSTIEEAFVYAAAYKRLGNQNSVIVAECAIRMMRP